MKVYGKNVALDIIKSHKKINSAIVSKNFNEENILNYLKKSNVKIKYMEKYEIDKITDGLHQGIVLDIEDFKYTNLSDVLKCENPLLIVLDHLEDPHNLGAIIRTCEAAGVDGIIIPKDRSVEVNATVYKTSVGTVESVPIIMVTNIANTIDELKKEGFWITGTDMEGTNYKEIDYKGKSAIVIGNEGKGISKRVLDNCDFIASIPMYGKTNSLNVSVASGIIIYEAVTSRKLG